MLLDPREKLLIKKMVALNDQPHRSPRGKKCRPKLRGREFKTENNATTPNEQTPPRLR